jgi:hypothetical protein
MSIDFTATGGAPWRIYVDGVELLDVDGSPFSYASQHNALEKLAEVEAANPDKDCRARQVNEIRADETDKPVDIMDQEIAEFTLVASDSALVRIEGTVKVQALQGAGAVMLDLVRIR